MGLPKPNFVRNIIVNSRKYEARNPKSETNPKYESSNVQNDINLSWLAGTGG